MIYGILEKHAGMGKEEFIKLYYDDLESLSTISKLWKQNKTTITYRAKTIWGLELRDKSEAAIIAYKKNRKDNSGIRNGRFIDDGLESVERYKVKSYGLTAKEYLSMKKEQGSRCKICGKSEYENGKKLAIDHCHKTKTVRGLLCDKCNRGIGFLEDNTEIMQNAINYLNEFKASWNG
jgi:hypothetical protein